MNKDNLQSAICNLVQHAIHSLQYDFTLLNFWPPLLSKTYFISEQFILLLALWHFQTSSSTDENMTKDKLQRFQKGESDSTEATSHQKFQLPPPPLTPHASSLSLSSRLKTGTWT